MWVSLPTPVLRYVGDLVGPHSSAHKCFSDLKLCLNHNRQLVELPARVLFAVARIPAGRPRGFLVRSRGFFARLRAVTPKDKPKHRKLFRENFRCTPRASMLHAPLDAPPGPGTVGGAVFCKWERYWAVTDNVLPLKACDGRKSRECHERSQRSSTVRIVRFCGYGA